MAKPRDVSIGTSLCLNKDKGPISDIEPKFVPASGQPPLLGLGKGVDQVLLLYF